MYPINFWPKQRIIKCNMQRIHFSLQVNICIMKMYVLTSAKAGSLLSWSYPIYLEVKEDGRSASARLLPSSSFRQPDARLQKQFRHLRQWQRVQPSPHGLLLRTVWEARNSSLETGGVQSYQRVVSTSPDPENRVGLVGSYRRQGSSPS